MVIVVDPVVIVVLPTSLKWILHDVIVVVSSSHKLVQMKICCCFPQFLINSS